MPKIKNVTGEDRELPWLNWRFVPAGAVIEVPDSDVFAYTQQDGWDPADAAAQSIHDDAAHELDQVEAAQEGLLAEPAGNASRDDWALYVTATGLATDAQLEDLTRDQIRDTYKHQED